MLHRTRTVLTVASVLLLATASCHDDTAPATGDDDADAASAEGEARGDALASRFDLSGDDAVLAAGKIGAVLVAIHDGEITHAQVAARVAADVRVRNLAARLMQVHTDLAGVVNRLLDSRGIALVACEVSDALYTEADATLARLQTSTGADAFDGEYIRAQIATHAEAFVLTGRLIETAPFSDLLDLTASARLTVAEHRVQIEELLRAL